jgi:sulfur-carrier protein
MIRVILPYHLRNLAQVGKEVELQVAAPVTLPAVLDALEAAYPVLRGTIRDQVTAKRRPLIRFFATGRDVTDQPPDIPLPDAIATGADPLWVVGAIAGG